MAAVKKLVPDKLVLTRSDMFLKGITQPSSSFMLLNLFCTLNGIPCIREVMVWVSKGKQEMQERMSSKSGEQKAIK